MAEGKNHLKIVPLGMKLIVLIVSYIGYAIGALGALIIPTRGPTRRAARTKRERREIFRNFSNGDRIPHFAGERPTTVAHRNPS